uniref:Subtilisin-like protease SBT1.8 n=1 Tax=Tanacetum cinerariifolium TaxID=118510 RepID=A0A699IP59_TANCI|nr:subtilisin-like protease SBT1.8 [Tanacetum cinerariifolium]
MIPVTKKVCEEGEDFKVSDCNKKLIGARKFSKGFRLAAGAIGKEKESPRDKDGHGTHTASTTTGCQVGKASLLGFANGIARGMAVYARVATYKVCWKTRCFGSVILAGMDRAILDVVDVLSMSLGGGSEPYYRDIIAIGVFKAMCFCFVFCWE